MDRIIGQKIFERILVMLINEAVDALFWQVGTKEAIEIAMIKGVNYPRGLFAWAEELGYEWVLEKLESLFHHYGEDRYRPSPLLRKLIMEPK
jgi:3-hydroxybutyryl-CoA dehydrogenase